MSSSADHIQAATKKRERFYDYEGDSDEDEVDFTDGVLRLMCILQAL